MKFQGEVLDYFNVQEVVSNIFSGVMHAKRIQSVASAALGVIASGSLIIHRIGRGLAKANNLSDKHAIKQVDRLLSNEKLNIEKTDKNWVSFLIGWVFGNKSTEYHLMLANKQQYVFLLT